MAVRSAMPAARTAAMRARAKSSGAAVSFGASGEILVSMLKRTASLPGLAHEREEIGEPRNARAVHRLLAGKRFGVGAAGLDGADVVALQLLVGEVPDRGTGRAPAMRRPDRA